MIDLELFVSLTAGIRNSSDYHCIACMSSAQKCQRRLKARCHPRISYGHTKFISQVHSKNVGTSVDVSFHTTGF